MVEIVEQGLIIECPEKGVRQFGMVWIINRPLVLPTVRRTGLTGRFGIEKVVIHVKDLKCNRCR